MAKLFNLSDGGADCWVVACDLKTALALDAVIEYFGEEMESVDGEAEDDKKLLTINLDGFTIEHSAAEWVRIYDIAQPILICVTEY